jgi:hypothetical protein
VVASTGGRYIQVVAKAGLTVLPQQVSLLESKRLLCLQSLAFHLDLGLLSHLSCILQRLITSDSTCKLALSTQTGCHFPRRKQLQHVVIQLV